MFVVCCFVFLFVAGLVVVVVAVAVAVAVAVVVVGNGHITTRTFSCIFHQKPFSSST